MREFHLGDVLAAWPADSPPGVRPAGVNDRLDKHYKEFELGKLVLRSYKPTWVDHWRWSESIAAIIMGRPDAVHGWLGDPRKARYVRPNLWLDDVFPHRPVDLSGILADDRLAYARCTRAFMQDGYNMLIGGMESSSFNMVRDGDPVTAE